jgi:hypothetical protein
MAGGPERTRGRKYHLSSANTLRARRGQDNGHGMPALIGEGRTLVFVFFGPGRSQPRAGNPFHRNALVR